jgi:hypothetical protein
MSGGPLATASSRTTRASSKNVSFILLPDIVQIQEDSTSSRIQKLTQQLNDLKVEHYQLVGMNKEQSEKLTRELENSIKTHYLKNVLLSYLTTNEASVQ